MLEDVEREEKILELVEISLVVVSLLLILLAKDSDVLNINELLSESLALVGLGAKVTEVMPELITSELG